MRVTKSNSPNPYLSDTPDYGVQATPRVPSSHFRRTSSGFRPDMSSRDFRIPPPPHHHPSPRMDRGASRTIRDDRRSVSGSESSSDDNEYRSSNHRYTQDTRSPRRERFATDGVSYRNQTTQSYFSQPHSYPLNPAFGLPRYPSQSWFHPSPGTGDHGMHPAVPPEFRGFQRGLELQGDRNRVSGFLSNDHRALQDGMRGMAAGQAYYPYPHPDYVRVSAPIETLQQRPGFPTASQRVPARLRTSQACEKCRKRKVKCTGDRPTCGRCAVRGFICEYAISEKDEKYKAVLLRGPDKARHQRRTKSCASQGLGSTKSTDGADTSVDVGSQSDRRPSDSSLSSESSNDVDMGHFQHEESRYMAYPYPSGYLGYPSIRDLGSIDQSSSYRRLSVKDLLNPQPPTPLNAFYSDGSLSSRGVYASHTHLGESGVPGSPCERMVVEFPSTSPKITQDRLPVMVASEALGPPFAGRTCLASGSGSPPGRARGDRSISPPSSSAPRSIGTMKQGLKVLGGPTVREKEARNLVPDGDFSTMRGRDRLESDSSMSSHDPSPVSEVSE